MGQTGKGLICQRINVKLELDMIRNTATLSSYLAIVSNRMASGEDFSSEQSLPLLNIDNYNFCILVFYYMTYEGAIDLERLDISLFWFSLSFLFWIC